MTIYIKEAHTTDQWQVKNNETQDVCYAQPKTLAQRLAIANDFVNRFQYNVPLLVDPIENPANVAFSAMPERLYIIDENGMIVYKGELGPFEYKPEEVELWLTKRFSRTTSNMSSPSPLPVTPD